MFNYKISEEGTACPDVLFLFNIVHFNIKLSELYSVEVASPLGL